MGIVRARHVTWSPDVAPVSRQNSPVLRQRKTKLSIHVTRRDDGGSVTRRQKHVEGHLIGHIRKNSNSALLTIYNRSHHRVLQLLISIPHERVRRIFDGERSWTVVDSGGVPQKWTMTFAFENFGTILWRDEDRIRRADAKGFCVKWLAQDKEWPVRLSKAPVARVARSIQCQNSKPSESCKPVKVMTEASTLDKAASKPSKPRKPSKLKARRPTPKKPSKHRKRSRSLTSKPTRPSGKVVKVSAQRQR